MKIWIVIYEHKHGVDAWPVSEEPDVDGVKAKLREEGSWEDEDDTDYRSRIEIRGPWVFS